MPLKVRGLGRWRGHLAGLAGAALLVLVALLGVLAATEEVYSEQPHGGRTVGELVAGKGVGQTFRAEHAGLAEVALRMGTYDRRNRGPLTYRLEGPALAEAVTGTVAAAELEDNAYHGFEVPPIADSAGQPFTFTLEAPEATRGNAVTVWGTAEDAYPEGEAVVRGLEEGRVRDLAFRLTYEPRVGARVGIFVERLAAAKPSVWGDERLYAVLGGTYVVLVYALLAATVGGRGREGPRG